MLSDTPLPSRFEKWTDHPVGSQSEAETLTPPGIAPRRAQDAAEFRKWGKEMVDYIADYLRDMSLRRVTPNVQPGYLRELIPLTAPVKGENWAVILEDVEKYIMPGVTHWQHPQFHAYFTAGSSYTSLMGDMLSDAMNCIGFSWASSPANTELEVIVLDWLGKMIGLPEEFLNLSEKRRGGGVIQSSASECVLVSLLAARHDVINSLKQQHPSVEEAVLLSKLVAYTSKEAHSSVEKAAMVGFVKMRMLETDHRFRLRGPTLAKAMEDDRANGLIPFFVVATLGTTSCCSFDALEEIGEICRDEDIWLHVDASYAGTACICPEFKYLLKGVQHAMSFNMTPHKWMLVNHDCSTMWVQDKLKLTRALNVDPLYLQHVHSDKAIDYRHWGLPLSRRFRALKIWFVLRKYGVEGLQSYIREHVRLAKVFENFVINDNRFEVVNDVHLGLICFRFKGSNSQNERLLSAINASGKIHMVPSSLKGRYVIRFCVCAEHSTNEDVQYGWDVIEYFTNVIIEGNKMDAIDVHDGTETNGLKSFNGITIDNLISYHEKEVDFHDSVKKDVGRKMDSIRKGSNVTDSGRNGIDVNDLNGYTGNHEEDKINFSLPKEINGHNENSMDYHFNQNGSKMEEMVEHKELLMKEDVAEE